MLLSSGSGAVLALFSSCLAHAAVVISDSNHVSGNTYDYIVVGRGVAGLTVGYVNRRGHAIELVPFRPTYPAPCNLELPLRCAIHHIGLCRHIYS